MEFIKHYWKAFFLIVLSLLCLVDFLLIYTSQGTAAQEPFLYFLAVPIGAGVYRGFKNGWNPRAEFDQTASSSTQKDEGCFLGLVVLVLQTAILTLLWPFVTLFWQIRFLLKANSFWKRGEVLVDENGKAVRAA
jgi:hypothetical protein